MQIIALMLRLLSMRHAKTTFPPLLERRSAKQRRGGRHRVQWKWQWPEEEEVHGLREGPLRANLIFPLRGVHFYNRVVPPSYPIGVQLPCCPSLKQTKRFCTTLRGDLYEYSRAP